jgi:hypothetical protein
MSSAPYIEARESPPMLFLFPRRRIDPPINPNPAIISDHAPGSGTAEAGTWNTVISPGFNAAFASYAPGFENVPLAK